MAVAGSGLPQLPPSGPFIVVARRPAPSSRRRIRPPPSSRRPDPASLVVAWPAAERWRPCPAAAPEALPVGQ
uniref:Uncharacterized protein n=1 Tax=Oryza rufipogon TaxID=4529 RepID=A0A0E0QWA7_ORYRU